MGKQRILLPNLPKSLLSRQQRIIYELSEFYSTREISNFREAGKAGVLGYQEKV